MVVLVQVKDINFFIDHLISTFSHQRGYLYWGFIKEEMITIGNEQGVNLTKAEQKGIPVKKMYRTGGPIYHLPDNLCLCWIGNCSSQNYSRLKNIEQLMTEGLDAILEGNDFLNQQKQKIGSTATFSINKSKDLVWMCQINTGEITDEIKDSIKTVCQSNNYEPATWASIKNEPNKITSFIVHCCGRYFQILTDE